MERGRIKGTILGGKKLRIDLSEWAIGGGHWKKKHRQSLEGAEESARRIDIRRKNSSQKHRENRSISLQARCSYDRGERTSPNRAMLLRRRPRIFKGRRQNSPRPLLNQERKGTKGGLKSIRTQRHRSKKEPRLTRKRKHFLGGGRRGRLRPSTVQSA